jgi:hypothetical protein
VKCRRVSTVTLYNKPQFPYESLITPGVEAGQGVGCRRDGRLESPGRRSDAVTVVSAVRPCWARAPSQEGVPRRGRPRSARVSPGSFD